MRVNVYAEEMTDRIQIISKRIEGRDFTGLRFFLELPVTKSIDGEVRQLSGPFMHHPGDDDSAAVTFWGKQDLRVMLRIALERLDEHYACRQPPLETKAVRPDGTTHSEMCFSYGPKHYGCALAYIEKLETTMTRERLTDAQRAADEIERQRTEIRQLKASRDLWEQRYRATGGLLGEPSDESGIVQRLRKGDVLDTSNSALMDLVRAAADEIESLQQFHDWAQPQILTHGKDALEIERLHKALDDAKDDYLRVHRSYMALQFPQDTSVPPDPRYPVTPVEKYDHPPASEIDQLRAQLISKTRLADKLSRLNDMAKALGYELPEQALEALGAMKRGPRSSLETSAPPAPVWEYWGSLANAQCPYALILPGGYRGFCGQPAGHGGEHTHHLGKP